MMTSPILDAILAVEQAQAEREARLRAQVVALELRLADLRQQWSEASNLAGRRTLQVGFLVSYLKEKGCSRDEINRIAGGDVLEGDGPGDPA